MPHFACRSFRADTHIARLAADSRSREGRISLLFEAELSRKSGLSCELAAVIRENYYFAGFSWSHLSDSKRRLADYEQALRAYVHHRPALLRPSVDSSPPRTTGAKSAWHRARLQGLEILRYEGLRGVELWGRFDSSSTDSIRGQSVPCRDVL
jgi:hypothetical protein